MSYVIGKLLEIETKLRIRKTYLVSNKEYPSDISLKYDLLFIKGRLLDQMSYEFGTLAKSSENPIVGWRFIDIRKRIRLLLRDIKEILNDKRFDSINNDDNLKAIYSYGIALKSLDNTSSKRYLKVLHDCHKKSLKWYHNEVDHNFLDEFFEKIGKDVRYECKTIALYLLIKECRLGIIAPKEKFNVTQQAKEYEKFLKSSRADKDKRVKIIGQKVTNLRSPSKPNRPDFSSPQTFFKQGGMYQNSSKELFDFLNAIKLYAIDSSGIEEFLEWNKGNEFWELP